MQAVSLIRRRREPEPTRNLMAAEAAQREAAQRRAAAERSGERISRLAAVLGGHLEANNFGPRLEAALTIGREPR